MHFYFKIKKTLKTFYIYGISTRRPTVPSLYIRPFISTPISLLRVGVHGFVHQRFLSCVYVHSRGCGSLYFYAIF